MKVTYRPVGINNFHNAKSINVVLTGDKTDYLYHVSPSQAKRIRRHFCGISDCRCPGGAVQQLNEAGTAWGIPVAWCQEVQS